MTYVLLLSSLFNRWATWASDWLSHLHKATPLARERWAFIQSDSNDSLYCQRRKSGSWPKGPWQTQLLAGAHCWGPRKNLQTVSVFLSGLTVLSLPPPEAGKVGAVFPCLRWGNWLWVREQGKVNANAELGWGARLPMPWPSRFTTNTTSPVGSFLPSTLPTVRPVPFGLSKSLWTPQGSTSPNCLFADMSFTTPLVQ